MAPGWRHLPGIFASALRGWGGSLPPTAPGAARPRPARRWPAGSPFPRCV